MKIIKRLFCKHEYKKVRLTQFVTRTYWRHYEADECIKCGKRINYRILKSWE